MQTIGSWKREPEKKKPCDGNHKASGKHFLEMPPKQQIYSTAFLRKVQSEQTFPFINFYGTLITEWTCAGGSMKFRTFRKPH